MLTPDSAAAGQSLARTSSELPMVTIGAARGWGEKLQAALADLGQTFGNWRLIWTLSLFDIRLRYRGSLLGPFWLTLSTAIMVAAIGFVYSGLFRQNITHYLPFLAISLVLWSFISTITSEGSTCFTMADTMIRAQRLPHSLHAARVVARNLLVLAHNLGVIVVVFIIFPTVPSAAVISVIPALALWLVDAFALALLLGIVGARFRDIPPIVGSLMQIAFYLTPIMWSASMLAHRGISVALIQCNPFNGMLEIVRGPLLGLPFEPGAWVTALGYSALLLVITFLVFLKARSRIPYWV